MDSNHIRIAPYAQGTVVLRLEGEVKPSNIDLEIISGEHSHLKIALFQNIENANDLQMQTICKCKRFAKIDFIQFHLGGSSVKVSLIQEALGEQAELNADLLSRTNKDQKHHFEITNVYKVKNGCGKILAKGIALDSSHITINGGIDIGRNGDGTDAYLRQDSLLLSKKAGIQAAPGLRINTNDVKAGHGASITNLNDELLFYLMSRGIDQATARKMMISGFAAEQLEKIKDLPELQKEIKYTL